MALRLMLLVLWIVPVALAVVGAAALNRRGGRWNAEPAFRAGAIGAVAALVAFGLARGTAWLAGSTLMSWVRPASGSTADQVAEYAARLELGAAVVFSAAVLLTALPRAGATGRNGREHPAAVVIGAIAGFAALASFVALAAAPVELESIVEPVALAPMVGLGLVLHLVAPRLPVLDPPPPMTTDAPSAPPPPSKGTAAPNSEAILRQQGLLRAGADFTSNPSSADLRDDDESRVWAACGGAQRCPDGVVGLVERLGRGGPGVLVGDLPSETKAAFLRTLAVLSLGRAAGRALVVCTDAEALVASVEAALDQLGLPRPGPIVARVGPLKDRLARGESPALVCLGYGDLAGEAIELLGRREASWLATLDVVVLCDADRLPPIEATHLAFTVRRLAIAVEEHRGTPLWVGVGSRSPGLRRYLEEAAGRPFKDAPLGHVHAAAAVRVYLRRTQGDAALREIESFAEALAAGGASFELEDGVGVLADRRALVASTHSHVALRPGYHGACALAFVEDREVARLFRARRLLAHQLDAAAHVGYWWIKESPLARFLAQRGTLESLEREDQLPSPRPVVGLRNPWLVAAHLEAALHEGRPDEVALRRAFGDAAVDRVLASDSAMRIEGTRARWEPASRAIERTRILVRPGNRWPDERRETVTPEAVEVRNRSDGALLRRVDAAVARTRYYPHRVFTVGSSVYRVGSAVTGPTILASPAEAGAIPTRPVFRFALDFQGWRGEIERHQLGRIAVGRAVAAVTVREEVSGAIPLGSAVPSVRYAPVEARYDSVAAAVLFERAPSPAALAHVGRVLDLVLPSQLAADDEDIEVLAFAGGFGTIQRPALVFVDRNVGGVGVAEALDARTVHELLRWSRGVLHSCPCMNGCPECTPPDVLASGPDKQGALKLLGG